MRVTVTASIRLLFILTLVAISGVAQTGLISASAPTPASVRTTPAFEIGLVRDCSGPEESSRWRVAIASTRVACAPQDPERHALIYCAAK